MLKEIIVNGLVSELGRHAGGEPVRVFLEELLEEVRKGEVGPVAEAEWVDDVCSACGGLCHDTYDYTSIWTAYCPHCGARMRNSSRWDGPRERCDGKKEAIVKGLGAALESYAEGDTDRGFLSELMAEVMNGTVAPAAEGEWAGDSDWEMNCSACGGPVHHSYGHDEMTGYCHHCGAKMKKVERRPPRKEKASAVDAPAGCGVKTEKATVKVIQTLQPFDIDSLSPVSNSWEWFDSPNFEVYDDMDRNYEEAKDRIVASLARSGFYRGVRILERTVDPETRCVREKVIKSFERKSFRKKATGRLEGPLWVEETDG